MQRRLTEAGIEPEVRRSALTGKLYEHYPPESIGVLLRSKLERPGNPPKGWLTAEAMPASVGRSYNWVKRRLCQYEGLAERHRDEQGTTRLHYPPSVTNALKEECEGIEAFPAADNYLTLSAIVKHTGRSKLWVSNRLKLINVSVEKRRDRKGRVREHYPPETVRLILDLPPDLRTK